MLFLRVLLSLLIFQTLDLSEEIYGNEICLCLPLSENHGQIGKTALKGFESLWRARLLEQNIRVKVFDTKGSLEGVKDALSQADQSGCVVILGGLGDKEAIWIARGAEERGIPAILVGNVHEYHKNAIWVRIPRTELMETALEFVIKKMGKHRIVIVGQENNYAKAIVSVLEQKSSQLGGEIYLKYLTLEKDLQKVSKMVANQLFSNGSKKECVIDAIFLLYDIRSACKIVPFLEFEGIFSGDCAKPILVGPPIWNDPVTISRGCEQLDGAIFPYILNRMGGIDIHSYLSDGVMVVLEAVKITEKWERQAIISVFQKGFSIGSLKVENGRINNSPVGLMKISGGTITPMQTGDN